MTQHHYLPVFGTLVLCLCLGCLAITFVRGIIDYKYGNACKTDTDSTRELICLRENRHFTCCACLAVINMILLISLFHPDNSPNEFVY